MGLTDSFKPASQDPLSEQPTSVLGPFSPFFFFKNCSPPPSFQLTHTPPPPPPPPFFFPLFFFFSFFPPTPPLPLQGRPDPFFTTFGTPPPSGCRDLSPWLPT